MVISFNKAIYLWSVFFNGLRRKFNNFIGVKTRNLMAMNNILDILRSWSVLPLIKLEWFGCKVRIDSNISWNSCLNILPIFNRCNSFHKKIIMIALNIHCNNRFCFSCLSNLALNIITILLSIRVICRRHHVRPCKLWNPKIHQFRPFTTKVFLISSKVHCRSCHRTKGHVYFEFKF